MKSLRLLLLSDGDRNLDRLLLLYESCYLVDFSVSHVLAGLLLLLLLLLLFLILLYNNNNNNNNNKRSADRLTSYKLTGHQEVIGYYYYCYYIYLLQ